MLVGSDHDQRNKPEERTVCAHEKSATWDAAALPDKPTSYHCAPEKAKSKLM